jgi:hypothetical protein
VYRLGKIVWPVGSTYGLFRRYAYDLSIAQGADIFVGFRYQQDVTIEGFFVHIDDVSVGGLTSVSQIDDNLPKKMNLRQNYPNPFNPVTTIEFAVPRSGPVALRVFNLLGEEVVTLVKEELSAGTYRIDWDASKVPSGVYFYRLVAGDVYETRKMVLSK